jgi:hypothetical protein
MAVALFMKPANKIMPGFHTIVEANNGMRVSPGYGSFVFPVHFSISLLSTLLY